MGNNKNHYIELCRFVASIEIMLHHSWRMGVDQIATGGWIFVEFFFMISGYFVTLHFNNLKFENAEKEALTYTMRKLMRIYPLAIIGIVLDIINQILLSKSPLSEWKRVLYSLPANLLLLGRMKLSEYVFDGSLWYLTGIMLTMPIIIIIIMLKMNSMYRYIFVWIAPIAGYSYLFLKYGNIYYWGGSNQLNLIMRAFCGLVLGSLSFYINEWANTKEVSDYLWTILSLSSIIVFALLLYLPFRSNCKDKAFFCVFCSLLFITIALNRRCTINKHIPACADELGRLSVALFCLHGPVFNLIKLYRGTLSNRVTFYGGIIFTVIVSAEIMNIVDGIRKNYWFFSKRE